MVEQWFPKPFVRGSNPFSRVKIMGRSTMAVRWITIQRRWFDTTRPDPPFLFFQRMNGTLLLYVIYALYDIEYVKLVVLRGG